MKAALHQQLTEKLMELSKLELVKARAEIATIKKFTQFEELSEKVS